MFTAAATAKNFRTVAQRLAVSPQTITRSIQQLEEALGEPLFHRNTRGVHLTAFGEQFLDQARNLVAGMDEVFKRRRSRAPSEHVGIVRITAPPFIGRSLLMRTLAPVQRAWAELQIDLRLSEAFADVVDQQIDVGIRVGMLRDSRLVARQVTQVPFCVVAAPELVERIGRPTDIQQLSTLPTTALVDRNTGRLWPWLFREGKQFSPAKPAFITDDPEAECDAVLAGIGIGQLSGLLAAEHLRSGRLVNLMTRHASEMWTLFVYRAQPGPVPARVRIVFDALVQALADLDLSFVVPHGRRRP